MKRRLRAVLVIMLTCLAGLLAWQFLHPREPVYQGKTLTAWLEQFSTNHFTHRGSTADKEAEEAIRQIGENALPVLLELIAAKESAFEKKVAAILPKRWQRRLESQQAWYRRTLATAGFVALGPIAKPAVPALMGLASSENPDIRRHAVYALGHLGSAAQPAIPLLIERLEDPVEVVRGDAMNGLAGIHLQQELVVPVFIQYAADPEKDSGLRYTAIQGLGYFGSQAKAAVPTLLRLLNDSDSNIRLGVTNYLRLVDPEAAAAAGLSN
jgi:HEAT repeat protein